MRQAIPRLIRAAAAAAIVAGCSDSTGPGTGLSTQQKAALITALNGAGAFGNLGPVSALGGLAIQYMNATGKLDAGASAIRASAAQRAIEASVRGIRASGYEGAVGLQLIMSVTTQNQTEYETLTGVIGWQGLDAVAQTVDEIVVAGAITLSPTPVGNNTTATIGSLIAPYGFAVYGNRASASAYDGGSGTFNILTMSFNESGSDCSGSVQAITFTCTYATGTMTGSFAFDSDISSGTGADTYSQPFVHFTTIPAIKLVIAATY